MLDPGVHACPSCNHPWTVHGTDGCAYAEPGGCWCGNTEAASPPAPSRSGAPDRTAATIDGELGLTEKEAAWLAGLGALARHFLCSIAPEAEPLLGCDRRGGHVGLHSWEVATEQRAACADELQQVLDRAGGKTIAPFEVRHLIARWQVR